MEKETQKNISSLSQNNSKSFIETKFNWESKLPYAKRLIFEGKISEAEKVLCEIRSCPYPEYSHKADILLKGIKAK